MSTPPPPSASQAPTSSTQQPQQSIPNLLSLRKGPRGPQRSAQFQQRSPVDHDRIVRETDGDASSSRISAVETGYLDDPFARALGVGFEAGQQGKVMRRLPLMNRGTYVRTTAIDRIVDTFLSIDHQEETSTPTKEASQSTDDEGNAGHRRSKQIISLGAGSDTRYFRLKRDKKHDGFTYHELDFLENTCAKISRLRDARCIELVKRECGVDLSEANVDMDGGEMNTDEYLIHALDLRELPENLPWLDTQASTLIISECCLIYLSPEAADNALAYFSHRLADVPLAMAIYEPFRPNDPFGQTMIRNLMTRGIVLKTIEKYADLERQKERLDGLGLEARAKDCEEIWKGWVNRREKERVDKLEWMDEVEEFVLLVKHYCVAWGWARSGDDEGWRVLDESVV